VHLIQVGEEFRKDSCRGNDADLVGVLPCGAFPLLDIASSNWRTQSPIDIPPYCLQGVVHWARRASAAERAYRAVQDSPSVQCLLLITRAGTCEAVAGLDGSWD
jgi:hypothetical protein